MVEVGTERLANPLAVAEARGHLVEASLEEADFASVVHGDLGREVSCLHAALSGSHRVNRVNERAARDAHRPGTQCQTRTGHGQQADGDVSG